MTDRPADVGDVLLDELGVIRWRRRILRGGCSENLERREPTPEVLELEKVRQYRAEVHRLGDLTALCLSGGGIRSAAFALGVVQGLAAKGLLARFDYLSTVSGGGYLGSFLTAWVQRRGYQAVIDELVHGPAPDAAISPLQHLRRYSNYLTPRTGVFSADTLMASGLYVRNLLLNWLVLLPMLLAAIIAAKLLAVTAWALPPSTELIAALTLATIMAVGAAITDSLQQRPGWVDEESNPERFVRVQMWPMLVAGVAASLAALKFYQLPLAPGGAVVTVDQALGEYPRLTVTLLAGGIFMLAAIAALAFSPPEPRRPRSTDDTIRTVGWKPAAGVITVFVLSGAASGFLLATITDAVRGSSPASLGQVAFLLICLGPPLLILAYAVAELLYIALTSHVPWGDVEREWLARAFGYHIRTAIAWALLLTLIFGGSYVVWDLYHNRSYWLGGLASTGGVAGVVTALVAKASTTGATLKERYESWTNRSAAVVLAIAMPVFVVVLVSFLSAGIDLLVVEGRKGQLWFDADAAKWIGGPFVRLLVLGAVVLGIGVLASRLIHTNRFSLHGVYRNRLIRAFLGASNAGRQPNRFIDMDQNDNLALCQIWPNRAPPPQAPTSTPAVPPQLHITNMALNIVATRELAWQERKALSFTASPCWVGCADLVQSDDHGGPVRPARGSYRPSHAYAGRISLGTAMTISGAAASPNMGYHSSPALSVLLTFFNVRLGAWLGNPGPAGANTYMRAGPRFAAMPLVQEALGLTTEDKPYVYLSDGGHFDNLGLYEMVRRRCHFIVVSDAGADPKAGFEDLGNAARKISIDLNVTIRFKALKIGPRKDPPVEGPYCAVGEIIYPDPDAARGLLLYVKPGYQGVEPASVRSYAAQNPIFPHESTGDQWFGESQFEAYRALGHHIVSSIDGGGQSHRDLRTFIEAVQRRMA